MTANLRISLRIEFFKRDRKRQIAISLCVQYTINKGRMEERDDKVYGKSH